MFMKIELWSLDRIRPYPNNPRINDDAVDAVAASIREFGVRQAIVVDTEGVIICGHTRFKAAQKLGLDNPRRRRGEAVASSRCVGWRSSNPSPCWLRRVTGEPRPHSRSCRRRSRRLRQG